MISVVIPLYNYSQYILENLQYIEKQTYKDWEVIIVDDASTDSPMDVLAGHLSDRIQYLKLSSNQGYGYAKNVGIRASSGEYIVVLDADDLLTPVSLELRLHALKKSNRAWIHARAYEFAGSPPYNFRIKRRKAVKKLDRMLQTGKYNGLWECIHAQTVMVHRSVYEKVGLYETSLRSMGDKEMWYRIIKNVQLPAFLDRYIVYYRQHGQQMHRSKEKKKHLDKYLSILNKCRKIRGAGDLSGVERL